MSTAASGRSASGDAPPSPPARVALDRDRVIATAIGLADRDGLAAVSMRLLATELGVTPMALYKHVADKHDLVGGMIDAIVSGYAAPPAGLGWSAAARERILSARTAMLRHPWLRSAIETRSGRTPAVLGHMDAVAGDLLSGGLPIDLTHHAMHALGHRIWGFSPEAFDDGQPPTPPTTDEELAAAQSTMLAMAQRFPAVAAIAAQSEATGGSCDEAFEFEFTLDLLLDAFARLHESGWTSRR